jgi:hypothetical protein
LQAFLPDSVTSKQEQEERGPLTKIAVTNPVNVMNVKTHAAMSSSVDLEASKKAGGTTGSGSAGCLKKA